MILRGTQNLDKRTGGVKILKKVAKTLQRGAPHVHPSAAFWLLFWEIFTPLQRFARFSMISTSTQNLDKRMGGVKISKRSSKNIAEERTSHSPLWSVLATFFFF